MTGFSAVDSFEVDYIKRFPLMAKAKYLEFDQFPGDLLIIPTGWFHQVINLVQVFSTGALYMFWLLEQVSH